MDDTQGVKQSHPEQYGRASGRELAVRQRAAVVQQPARGSGTPLAVSQSSYLNEKDRHFRAAETVENGGDLAERSVNGVLRLDAKLRAAELDGASPRALAAIERMEEVFGQTTGMLVWDYVNRPYERW